MFCYIIQEYIYTKKHIHYEMKQNTGTKFLHNFRFYTRLSLYIFEISCVFIRY